MAHDIKRDKKPHLPLYEARESDLLYYSRNHQEVVNQAKAAENTSHVFGKRSMEVTYNYLYILIRSLLSNRFIIMWTFVNTQSKLANLKQKRVHLHCKDVKEKDGASPRVLNYMNLQFCISPNIFSAGTRDDPCRNR